MTEHDFFPQTPQNTAIPYSPIDLEVLATAISMEVKLTGSCHLTKDQFEKLFSQACEAYRLWQAINTPTLSDFTEGFKKEAIHQAWRWNATDTEKAPTDWFWTLGYLAGKALNACVRKDYVKAQHHCITAAALCYHWWGFISGAYTPPRFPACPTTGHLYKDEATGIKYCWDGHGWKALT